MRLRSLSDLEPADERAVIINVGTKLFTTLALLSTLRHARMPVLLIDCESEDGSPGHFSDLMEEQPFDLLSAPRRDHGTTLDWLFRDIRANKVLLVDSDLEIVKPDIISLMRDFIDHESTFGSGFINGPGWLTDQVGLLEHNAYYQERPWMPLTMLKVAMVLEALRAGRSFKVKFIYNDFAPSYRISHFLAKLRLRVPRLRRHRFAWLDPFKRSFYGLKPSVVCCDTGAEIYQYLKYEREYLFVGLPEQFHPRYVTHFFGVTRAALASSERHGSGTSIEESRLRAARRLEEAYGFQMAYR